MSPPPKCGGAFTPAGASLALNRMGYGAIQLSGPMAFGPPRDHQAALAVVREAVRLGINHIDTSDYYGPTPPTRSSARRSTPIPNTW
jgi:aryl-alcohol dehydrogenase-like predicted oxidoreductase